MNLQAERLIRKTLAVLIIALIGVIVVLSWVPPVSRDALTHHLFVPKLYLKHGGIHEIPDIPFSYYPMNLDLLYMIPLYFGNDILPKLIHFSFALMTAWLVFSYLKKRVKFHQALLGAFFFLSIPIIVKLSITVYVDLGLIFFTTASLLLVLKWLETSKTRYLVFSGMMCGLSLGTKYNGLISLLLITFFIPVAYIRYPRKIPASQVKVLGYSGLFLLVSLILFSPWMIRNYILTQNPVYPLFDHWFHPTAPAFSHSDDSTQETESINVLEPFALRKVVYNENWWQLITIPVRIFFEGKDDKPKYFDGKLNPFLLIFPLFLFIGFKNQDPPIQFEIKFFAVFSILLLLLVFFQSDMRIRYAGSIIPPMVMLSILGLKHIEDILGRKANLRSFHSFLSLILMTVLLIPNALYLKEQFHIVDPFSYISGKVGRDDYIEKYRPEYRVIRYANQHLPKESRILFLFIGNRGYYSDRDVFFGYEWLKQELKKKASADSLSDAVKRKGITHLLIRADLFLGWAMEELPPNQGTIIMDLLNNHTYLLFAFSDYWLCEIRP